MRILQIIQRLQLRGAEIFACQLSLELVRMGVHVDVVYLFGEKKVLPFELNFISLGGDSGKRFWDFRAYKKLDDIIKVGQYDLIQANSSDTLKYAILSRLLFRWKAPLIFRNASKISDFLDSRPKYVLNKFFVNQLQHVISVSKLCRDDFVRVFNFPVHKIDVVQIGVSPRAVGDLPADLTHLFSKGPILINVASLVREKNHKGLLSIFEKVLKFLPDAQLILIGRGKLELEVKAMADQPGLRGNVHLLGARNDVLEIVKASDAFLLPSHIEGLPAVILEAQYCKIPVIAYNVGGISEVVNNGETGWLIEKDDEEHFVRAVGDVFLGDTDVVNQIARMASDQVTQQFDNKIIATRFHAVYQKVLEFESKKAS